MLLILFFIIVLNIVAIALTYYCLSDIEKRERIIFIAIGVAIIYILTSFVYWLSTKDIAIKEVSEMGKNLITFLFVPINGIIVLPILAKSYTKYKTGRLDLDKLKNRGLVLAMILAILLIIECMYFKDIQNSVVEIIEKNRQEQLEKEKSLPSITDEILNQVSDTETNETKNNISNTEENIIQTNGILNTEQNQISNVVSSNIMTNSAN